MKRLKNKLTVFLLIVAISISVSYKSDFFEIAKQIEIYTTLFKELNLYYVDEINPAEVMDKAIKSTLASLDPYTRFYDEQGVIDAKISAEGEYGGVGALIVYRKKNLLVKEVFEDYPAHKSGLKAGDKIIQIDNFILKEQSEELVRSLLKGLPNSTIQVMVAREKELLNFKIKRETVVIKAVPFYHMISDEVGYIAFVKFNSKASDEVKSAFEDLKSQGMKKLIIDVRHNPGGLLNEAIEIVNFFIPKNKIVVTTQAKLEKWSNTYKTRNDPLDTEIPLTILIDERSASASEILAGALQDYDRAVIIGTRSFGKGLVQRYRKLAYGTEMKLTISKYYTPSGRCIQELDYTNTDKEGNVPKFLDGKVNKFKTANGRKVYDGGGILPDIVIEKPKTLELTKQLYKSDAFFNFVTDYYYTNKTIKPANEFQLDQTIYESFKTYLAANETAFDTDTEKQFEKAMETAKKDGYNKEIEAQYKLFKTAILTEKIALLDSNKQEIIERLTEEIVKRYYYREGVYQQKLAFDTVIVQATDVLNNSKQYKKLLKK